VRATPVHCEPALAADKTILLPWPDGHIGENMDLGGWFREGVQGKCASRGEDWPGAASNQRMPRFRAAAMAAVREPTPSLPKMLVR
jgi:hypothetical protein